MKFKIRFADQIVGFFIILSIVSLVFVVLMLGRSYRWFSRDSRYHTILYSAGGLSNNMPILYRGFTIGNVTSFFLNDNDDVEVIFLIFEEYNDRVRLGSMMMMIESPIGLGSSFHFHPGRGAILPEDSFIPVAGSPQAQELIRRGLADEPRHEDSIGVIITRVNTTLADVNSILAHINEAIGSGSDETEIGRIIGSAATIMAEAEIIPALIDESVRDLINILESFQRDLEPAMLSVNDILLGINNLVSELNDPDGLIMTVLDTEEAVYTNLVESLGSVRSILDNLDATIAFLPSQIPQIAAIIMDLGAIMSSVEDVLVALANNPLLRGGIPQRPDTQGSGISPRDLRF